MSTFMIKFASKIAYLQLLYTYTYTNTDMQQITHISISFSEATDKGIL